MQVIETVFVTELAAQASVPTPLKVVVSEQSLSGTLNEPLKLADAPGASEANVKTGLLGAGRSLTTTMSRRVTLPVLLTLPEKVSNCPGLTGSTGHTFVTLRPGVKTSEHVVAAELVTVRGDFVN